MNDLLPPDSAKWVFFESACRSLFSRFGYGEIRTPILEPTALFSRGIGEATDIVEKEMYTFADRKGRSLTMRPEMTASCVRAYVEHDIGKREPVTRWFYAGPMFRYERMQTGRYRQFYQVGVEAYGVAEPTIDAEQIAMLYQLYAELKVPGIEIVINSVGSAEDRPKYREALIGFLMPKRGLMCGDCQRRIDTNPLRVLDCKVESCRDLVTDAPAILDHLGDESRTQFSGVERILSLLGVPFRVDPKCVRGLDYYTGTVFELVTHSGELGSQSTLAAGGRYDKLVESLGGPPTPAVGFALGIERAILSLPQDDAYQARPDLYIATRGLACRERAVALAHKLRIAGFHAECEHRDVGMKPQFKRADKLGAKFVLALGEDELSSGELRIRDMGTREETATTFDTLVATMSKLLGA